MEFRKKKPEKMSDGELLQELDRMIASAEAQAHPNPAASAILESLHPAMKAAMPETVKKAKQNLRALKQAKERLMDLMVEVAKKGAHVGKSASGPWSAGCRNWRALPIWRTPGREAFSLLQELIQGAGPRNLQKTVPVAFRQGETTRRK